MKRPPTAIRRAIDGLRQAAGDRPWLLVMDLTHPAAPTTRVLVRVRDNLPIWQAHGLARYAEEEIRLAQVNDGATDTEDPPEESTP